MFTSPHLSQPPGFSFRLKKCQHISFSDWALHVPDDGTVAVVHEFNTDLGEKQQFTKCSTKLEPNDILNREFAQRY